MKKSNQKAATPEPATLPAVGSWAIVELMGHVRIAGFLSEMELYGSKLGRIDIPNSNGGFVTQFFGGSSVYRITPTDEATARQVAKATEIAPVHPWQMPQRALTGQRDYTEEGF